MYDVIIIGAGPAGLSAALWCDELGLDALVLEQAAEVGGQLLHVHGRVGNHLGVEAADGAELRDIFAAQVEGCEFDIWTGVEIESVDLRAKRVRLRSGEDLQAIAVVLATGARRRRLGVPGEAELAGRGVIESAARERDSLAGKDVCVVGTDDSAAADALLLAEVCATVTLVNGGPKLSARPELAERVRSEHCVTVFHESELLRVVGEESVRAVEIRRRGALKPFMMAVGGVLVSAGVEPNTEMFRGQIEADERGYVRVSGERETSAENVFAVGDIANPLARTVSTAVGDGATAAKVIAARLGRS